MLFAQITPNNHFDLLFIVPSETEKNGNRLGHCREEQGNNTRSALAVSQSPLLMVTGMPGQEVEEHPSLIRLRPTVVEKLTIERDALS